MKYIPVLFTLFLFACGQNSSEKNTPDTAISSNIPPIAIYDQYLPQALVSYVQQSLPEWKLPDPTAWEKYWFDEYKKEKSLVNFITSDFNCDNVADHALILLNQKGDIGVWAFLARDGSFEKTKLDQFENLSGGPIGAGLLILEKGEHSYLGPEGEIEKPVKVNCEGVTVIFFEKAARSYYWENGKVKAIQTGD
jgi:hypothetical protein